MSYDHFTPAQLRTLTALDAWIAELRVCRLELLVFGKANFNPNQPRVPAGRPDGGQWTDQPYPDAIEEVYPIETALGLLTAGQALLALKALRSGRSAIAASESRIRRAAESIEEYWGGPGRFIRNKNGDIVLLRGDKKVRFDINNPGGDKPHFQFERRTPGGRWRGTGKQHRYYFREK